MYYSRFLAGSAIASQLVYCNAAPSLPVVDLGYVVQQASAINHTGGYINFTNIAFAEPPVGDLRFAAPKPPKRIKGVQNGGTSQISCPQGTPSWLSSQIYQSPEAPAIPQSEDCLYLDVMVPEKIFQRKSKAKAPVLVWIYGGGDVLGTKASDSSAGLVLRGIQETNTDGMIFVAMNYRLGSFGFTGGKEFVSQGGVANVGLYDQRLALEWVQDNIHKFGGDPSQVTVMGESGGATSAAYQMQANVGSKTPFQQAIFQSPTELPHLNDTQLDSQFQSWLGKLGVKNLQQARQLPSSKLQEVNNDIIRDAPYGNFGYGFTNDGVYVNQRAALEFLSKGFESDVLFIIAHNSNEGALFTENSNVTDFAAFVRSRAPAVGSEQLSHITKTLYPPPGRQTSYKSEYERALLFTTELYTVCNVYGYQKASGNRGFAYEWSVPPGWHILDVEYTFFNGPSDAVANDTIAVDMQTYFANFAVHHTPNAGNRIPEMPVYGSGHQLINLTIAGYPVVADDAFNPRCEYLADPRNAI